jgi:hypothetical protein
MIISFGTYVGRSVAHMMLSRPDYPDWVHRRPKATGEFLTLRAHMRLLAGRFDAKPYTCSCSGGGCGRSPTRVSVYRDSLVLMAWCEDCNPLQAGADASKLHVLRTYADALDYVYSTCPKPRANFAKVVLRWARMRGFPDGKVTEAGAEEYLPD